MTVGLLLVRRRSGRRQPVPAPRSTSGRETLPAVRADPARSRAARLSDQVDHADGLGADLLLDRGEHVVGDAGRR